MFPITFSCYFFFLFLHSWQTFSFYHCSVYLLLLLLAGMEKGKEEGEKKRGQSFRRSKTYSELGVCEISSLEDLDIPVERAAIFGSSNP